MIVKIHSRTIQKMKQHAESEYPNECCGFLFGRETGDYRNISELMPVANHKKGDRRRRFMIAPADYRLAEVYAEREDLLLLGVYHSHPDHPAEPSEHDRSVALPFFSYVIISVKEGRAETVRSWRLDDDRNFDEETVETEEVKEKQPM